jgi:hypothetical protein
VGATLRHYVVTRSARRGWALLAGVSLDVLLGSVHRVLFGVDRVGMGRVRVVGGFLGVSVLVMLGGFRVVPRSSLMVFCGLFVVSGSFLRHVVTPSRMMYRRSGRHRGSIGRLCACRVTGKLTERRVRMAIVRRNERSIEGPSVAGHVGTTLTQYRGRP